MLLAETLDLRDVATARHSETVGRYAEQIARALHFELARVERIRAAGILHDIGKLGIADAILHKPAALDPHEWVEIKRHPEIGSRILEHANLRDISAWVLAHHERMDGGGYPHGLPGDRDPDRGAHPRRRRRLRGDDRRPPIPPRAGTRGGARGVAQGRRDAVRPEIVTAFERVLDRTQAPFQATLAGAKPRAAVRSGATALP
jgi:putative nucleotidyltransferase with HDIG domain